MNPAPLRVGLDLAGSLEPLGDTMLSLARALSARDIELVEFATTRLGESTAEAQRTFPRPLRPLWRRGRGLAVDRLLPPLDVVHVAGQLVPPTVRTPLLVSVDDLRPLRDDSDGRWRVEQLRRAVDRGARLVATSYAARREVQAVLEIENSDIAVAPPAISVEPTNSSGSMLLVSVTGTVHQFLQLEPHLVTLAAEHHLSVVVLASREAGALIKVACPNVTVRSRARARQLLGEAFSVVHLSDGARFPSLAVASFAANVPVVATTTDVNRELLEGAADLVEAEDLEGIVLSIKRNVGDVAHRQLLASAGTMRAQDFRPAVAAERYERLYRDAVADWKSQ